MRALIIEDDKPLSDTLCRMLGSIAETDAAYDGESGLEKILTQEYDIVILDIMLPKMNGDEVLRNVRKHKLTPIIILSAIGMLERKVEFLNMGADDYMVKPFSREELLARVQATMRRYHRDFGALRYKLGDFNIDYKSKTVTYKDKVLPVSGKMYEVLETLVKNKEITVTKQQLFDSVCGFYSETIQTVIEVYVYRLRKILADIGMSECLQTIKTVGYRWREGLIAEKVHGGGGAMSRQIITTKSWKYRAWIAGLVTFAVLLILGIGIVAQAMESGDKVADKTMRDYAKQLKEASSQSLWELVGDGEKSDLVLSRENIDVIIYRRRPDDTAGYYTSNAYLVQHTSDMPLMMEKLTDEKIGDHNYKTFTFKYVEGEYVKLLMNADLLTPYDKLTNFIWYFPVAFVLIMGIYTAFAFLMGRPVVRAIKQQKEFIHEMTHEIRTPLTVIRGNMENALATPASTVEQVSDLLESTIEEAEHINTLSQDLMRSVSTPSVKTVKKIDAADIVSNVLEVYSEIIGESNRTLIANIQSVDVNIEGEKLKQLLIILLENAVKYTRDGDRIKVSLKKADNSCVLCVADTGIGIADGDEEKIFERFYRGENAKNKQGTGLGLAIARTITEEVGGRIYANHNIPSGILITAVLPERR